MKLSKAIEQFLAELALNSAVNTVKGYSIDLYALTHHVRPDTVLAVTEDSLVAYFTELSRKGAKMNTLRRKASTLSVFFQWGMRKRLWSENLMVNDRFRFRAPESVPHPFEADEAARLMALPLAGPQRVLRALLYYTGARITPLLSLLIGQVTFQPLRVEADGEVWELPGSLTTLNKGGKTLVVPMAPELAVELAEWFRAFPGRPQEHVVRKTLNGKPYRIQTAEDWCRKWGVAAEVHHCTPHRFRHTYATDLLRRGVRLDVIQRLLGHASVATTQIYTRVADASLVQAILRRSGQ